MPEPYAEWFDRQVLSGNDPVLHRNLVSIQSYLSQAAESGNFCNPSFNLDEVT